MRQTRVLLAAVALVALLALSACSTSQANLEGDGLHAVVPNVQGMSVENATNVIHDAGYEVGSVAPAGVKSTAFVAVQDPVAGTALPRGSEIDLQCKP